jgi:ppGpp synthetase/RelA/SpoT-type nucleotidyltranferase
MWEKEKGIYTAVCAEVERLLRAKIAEKGLHAIVSSRPKEVTSLVKKILRKGKTYEELTDKAGARVIVRFRDELDQIAALIEESFAIVKREDKTDELTYCETGYQAIHFDVKLKSGDDALCERLCELQLRTHCQDLWAVMAHELSYKAEIDVPQDLQRRIYLLNAVLEVADREFAELANIMRSLPGAHSLKLLQDLERYYYQLVDERFDRELSLEMIDFLQALYAQQQRAELPIIVAEFVQKNLDRLRTVYGLYSKTTDKPLFLSQPEIFLILERLEADPHQLEASWVQRFPREELESLSIAWGKSLD